MTLVWTYSVMDETRVTVEIADVFVHFGALRARVRVEIGVIRLAPELFRPVLQFAYGEFVPVAAFIRQMLSPIEFTRKSPFALFASVARFAVVTQMFLFPVLGQRPSIDEDLVTR